MAPRCQQGKVSPLVRRFLRGQYAAIDPAIPAMMDLLAERGAPECWHKHSTFMQHLVGVWRGLTLFNQVRPTAGRRLLANAIGHTTIRGGSGDQNLTAFMSRPLFTSALQ
mmetsp:Transcript_74436/g.212245  ORF Transcript_74436/g.212245 Transcript_74436/m.212245 type:complete len:110 (+) Transcript_74436:92-421(+)